MVLVGLGCVTRRLLADRVLRIQQVLNDELVALDVVLEEFEALARMLPQLHRYQLIVVGLGLEEALDETHDLVHVQLDHLAHVAADGALQRVKHLLALVLRLCIVFHGLAQQRQLRVDPVEYVEGDRLLSTRVQHDKLEAVNELLEALE